MSRGSKELFHSDTLARHLDRCPLVGEALLDTWQVPRTGHAREARVRRERHNLDLVVEHPGRSPLVIENKVFSLPDACAGPDDRAGRPARPTSTALALPSYAYYDAFVAKARITISLEQDQAERIRRHAERAGMDVSAYLVHAATRQMAESDAIEEQFAEVDALIARAERSADELPAEPAPEPTAELTEQERREVEEALGLVHGRDRQGRRPGHAA
ncbi:hypothetical protein ACFWOJ_02845 [Streptomyces sp. NPDC058439]|uniref:hypothetical protein n=1 Tax=Streptomyces sp. NPDC058439 TaxID=3346500 RepID=UPI003657CB8C